MAKRKKKSCLGGVWCVVQLLIHIFDLVTDCSTLVVYWQQQTRTVFALGVISVLLSLPIGLAGYVYQFQVCRGRKKSEEKTLTLKLLGILVESIPQLTMNLYILSTCEKVPSTIQRVSAGFSFLSICVGISHYDIKIKLHKNIGILQKLFIFIYRSCYLASRMLAFVYFSFTLAWWMAAVVVIHWGIGLAALMTNEVETLARSLAFVFLNTFVYVGRFAGMKALFILLLYVMENLMMIASAYIVSSQASAHKLLMTSTMAYAKNTTFSDVLISNDFAFLPEEYTPPSSTSSINGNDFYVKEFCLHSSIVPLHVALNVTAVLACCFYNVSFHYTECANVDSTEITKVEQEDLNQNALEENCGERPDGPTALLKMQRVTGSV